MKKYITRKEVEDILHREEVADAQKTLEGDQEKLALCRELLRLMDKEG